MAAANLASPSNPLAQYPSQATIHGSLVFYTHQPQYCRALHRGPIYLQRQLQLSDACLFSTTSSCIWLQQGEGYLQDVELRIIAPGGICLVKLRGKDLFVKETGDGEIAVARGSRAAGQFMLECLSGELAEEKGAARLGLCTLRSINDGGRSWWDEADVGWNTLGRGERLWVRWISEEDKRRWHGRWRPEYEVPWRP